MRIAFIFGLALITSGWAAGSAPDLPGMASGLLDQVQLARQSVTSRDSGSALDHVRQAETLADEIRSNAPAEPRPLLVPVFKEIDTTATYRPVKRGKEDEMSSRRFKKNTSVRDVEARVTTGKLDVDSAGARLHAAEQAIRQADWTAADGALAAIPDSIMRSQVEENMPLLKVRENLKLAQSRVLEGNQKEAKEPLLAAAQALGEYEKLSPGPRTNDAEYMRQQIVNCAGDLKGRRDELLARIDGWLQPVNEWVQAAIS